MQRASGIPCALCFREGEEFQQTSGATRRENRSVVAFSCDPSAEPTLGQLLQSLAPRRMRSPDTTEDAELRDATNHIGGRISHARGTGASRIHMHEIAQQRIDLVVPALAREHAVMADAGLHVVHLR